MRSAPIRGWIRWFRGAGRQSSTWTVASPRTVAILATRRHGRHRRVRCRRCHRPEARVRVLVRATRHEYFADHLDGRWIIRTMAGAQLPPGGGGGRASADRCRWRDLVPHRADAFVDGFSVFRGFLPSRSARAACDRVRIRRGKAARISTWPRTSRLHDRARRQRGRSTATRCAYLYTSLTTPLRTYGLRPATGERTLLKPAVVLGGSTGVQLRHRVPLGPARDGERVLWRSCIARASVAMARRRCCSSLRGHTPVQRPEFSLSTVGRCSTAASSTAVAQCARRPGLRPALYDAGRLLEKRNSFSDFIDVNEIPGREGYARRRSGFRVRPQRRRTAVGAIANMAPRDYKGIVTACPSWTW